MKVAVLKEKFPYEYRVAVSPETVTKMHALNFTLLIETGAGREFFPDQSFREAGATITSNPKQSLDQADIVLKVQRPDLEELSLMKQGTVVIGLLAPYHDQSHIQSYAEAGITSFALESLPRITRAQSMDVLSSQASLAGYKSVLEAVVHFDRSIPMMMTAAGTLPPAKCFVMGAGVAGLQAIATARRLGAMVSATDIRPATKEEVLSLGAKFIAVEDEEFLQAQTSQGYAKEMSDSYKQKQATLIVETLKKQDIIITTALIPGKPAPRLITSQMIDTLKPGSVIVDMAVEQGGNVEGSVPNQVTITENCVKILGFTNIPSRIAAAASHLYAKNILSFLQLLLDKQTQRLNIPWEDEIIKATLLTHRHKIDHPSFS